ncbi:MAG TPA: nuclear transport factor 2 family protein [Polyangiaceae bacterium]|nr:nuclear transport factor 2 family protein [Polyangiaceae bacterium]
MRLSNLRGAALFAALLAAAPLGCTSDDDGGAPPVEAAPIEAAEDADAVAAARDDLDALYKGDYRRAFVEKNPDFFLRHIPDDFTSTQVDGSRARAAELRQFFPQFMAAIERTLEHNVTIEQVKVRGDRIEAVVTLTTVLDLRSPAGVVYNEISVGTYLDTFVRRDGTLFEVSGEQLRSSVTGGPRP